MDPNITSEVNIPPSTDLESKLKNSTFEVVPPDKTRDMTKALYRNLMDRRQSYSATNFDFGSGRYMERPQGGGIFSVQSNNAADNERLSSIFVNKDNNIVGYGAITTTDNPSEVQASFKVFPEYRSVPKVAMELFEDNITNYLALNQGSLPEKIIIPPNQQYNPELSEKPTGAPVFYRILGFEAANGDANLTPELRSKIDSAKRGLRVQFDEAEYIEMAKTPLARRVPKELENVKALNPIKMAGISNKSTSRLDSVIRNNAQTSNTGGIDKERLLKLRARLAS